MSGLKLVEGGGQGSQAEIKDLYDIGEIPPLGHVPAKMHAWTIRKERHGPPETAMQLEVVPTWQLDSHDVLVLVMAAGVNYNGVWAALGEPISPLDGHKQPFHIAGSDASGIVWAVGSKVKRWKVGDEVVVHCNQDDGDDEECNGGDPMFSSSQRIWGYETPDGSFAQFCRVQDRQLMERPKHLTWEESASYTLTLATAYRMLFGHEPHRLKPGDNVLIWGASGGLGVFGVQLCAAAGANAIGVISDESKREYVLSLGAKGVINRKDFDGCWGQLPKVNTPEFNAWLETIPQYIKEIVFVVKRFHKPSWGDSWRDRFSVDAINGLPGNELKFLDRKMITTHLRVGYLPGGAWRTFGLRKDFMPAIKVQQEDDITASVVVPAAAVPSLPAAFDAPCDAGEIIRL